jgi:small subunit ribosomal protein S20
VPNIASAKKNMRKSRSATVRNRAQRSALRTALKKAKAPSASAEERLEAVSLLDRAARKGLVHKNLAARQKSKMAKAANACAFCLAHGTRRSTTQTTAAFLFPHVAQSEANSAPHRSQYHSVG